MIYRAKYIQRRGENLHYYQEIVADSINEAIRLADKHTKKGYICIGVTSREIESA
jgi:hypothetical protein